MLVAHLIQRYPPALGGSEAYFARLSRYLVERGDDVTVHTTTGDALESFWDRRAAQLTCGESWIDGVRVVRHALWHVPIAHRYVMKVLSMLPFPSWQALTVPFNPISPSMWSLTGSFDLVHVSAFPYSFPLECGRRLAQRLQIPFLVTPFVHTGDPRDPNDRVRRAYTTPALLQIIRSADAVFVQTEGEKLTLIDHGLHPDRIILQGLGVDVASCTGGDRNRARRRWSLTDDAVIGHLANNSAEKGSIDLLQAAQLAWEKGCRFSVFLAGSEMPNFRAFWDSFRPIGRVVRGGVLREEEKRDFFAAIDAFVLPSRSDSFGLVFPESWANRVPCVAYRAGGVAWVIRDQVDGLLVPCGDVTALADAIMLLIRDRDLRQRMGEAGFTRLPEFDWQEKLSLVRDSYVKCLERNKDKRKATN